MDHGRGDSTGSCFDTSPRSVIDDQSALDRFPGDSFQKGPKTSAPKNGLPFAIKDVITRLSQRENIADKIGLAACSVFPDWFSGEQQSNLTERRDRWQRNQFRNSRHRGVFA